MPLPLPEFLRNYGDLLRGPNGSLLHALVWLVGSVLTLLVVFTVGALVQSLVRWWQRSAERRKQDIESAKRGADSPAERWIGVQR